MKSAETAASFLRGLERVLREPRPAPQAWPSRLDIAIGVFIATVAGIEFFLRPEVTVIELAVLAICAPAVVFRRVSPLGALALGFLASTAVDIYQLAAGVRVGDMASSMFMLILPYSLFRWGSAREIVGGVVLASITFAVGVVSDGLPSQEAIGGVAVLTVAFGFGLVIRLRERSRVQKIESAKSRERERIARDLHDTVAHHVSGIAVRAQAGLALGAKDPTAAIDALRVIASEASRTLDEMRAMVGTLRGEASVEYEPHTGLHALASLTDSQASLPVHLETVGRFDGVTDAVGGAVHRIAQEAITNARRHARDATRIDVRVEVQPDGVHLEVVNDGRPASRTSRDSGYGLIGMRERAELLGGTLEAEPRDEGGFRVVAVLPKRGPA
ncbi:MAG: sensor histidine kinase [Myxococcota bacterium]